MIAATITIISSTAGQLNNYSFSTKITSIQLVNSIDSIAMIVEFLKATIYIRGTLLAISTYHKTKSILQYDIADLAKSTEEILNIAFTGAGRQMSDVDTSGHVW